jgi:hypothetical protein
MLRGDAAASARRWIDTLRRRLRALHLTGVF